MKKKYFFLLTTVLLLSASCKKQLSKPKTVDVSGEYYDWTKTMQPEQPWIRNYDKTLVMKFFLCSRNAEGNVDKVYLKFEDALEVLRKIDNITLGIPKIVYLVGWQYNGHDSKYPAMGEVNESLKRENDATALESLKWLIKEAKTYNTSISLHINMFDAYQDSPLWSEYLAKDIIAKDKRGEPIKGEIHDGMQSYAISYAQEWKLGYTQKRIDNLIKMIPELKESGTIHIDAFHSMRPNGPKEPISPYLGTSINDEISTQRKIFRYWRKQGIDVTCEGGMYSLRKDPFIGLQGFSWWHYESTYVKEDWLNKPANFSFLPAQFSGYTPMHAEGEIKKDPEKLSGLLEQFCLSVVPWYYRRNPDASKGGTIIILEDEVICPILWKDKAFVAFNKQADINEKRVILPTTWVDTKEVQLFDLTIEGLKPKSIIRVKDGVIYLSVKKNQPSVIMPI